MLLNDVDCRRHKKEGKNEYMQLEYKEVEKD